MVRYLPLVLLALLWEAVARLGIVSPSELPALSDVVIAWFGMIKSGELLSTAPPRSTGPARDCCSRSSSAARLACAWRGGVRSTRC